MSKTVLLQQRRLGADIFSGDPYAHYRALRSQGPIHWAQDLFGGAWLLTTFEGVQAALRDSRLSAQRTGGWVMRQAMRRSTDRHLLTDMQRLFARAMLFVDKPAHPRLRATMQVAFHPARLQPLRGFVSALAEDLIKSIEQGAPGTEPFDFIEHFATPLPARVISRFLGLRMTDESRFLSWSMDVATFLGSIAPTIDETMDARAGILGMGDAIDRCVRDGALDENGMVACLATAAKQGEIESGPEMLAQCAMLLFAGHETTRHLLGTAVYWLLCEPSRWRAIEDPARLRSAVRELLRWDSPVQYTGRRANCAYSLFGADIRRGDLVLPLIGAANRDPARFENAELLDLDRNAGMPLSFGAGPHACIGSGLTLMELECAIGALVRRWPDLRLADANPPWIESPLYRGLKTLWLRRATP